MKKYITSKKDNKIIDSLLNDLYDKERIEEEYKKSQRVSTRYNIKIKLKYCDNIVCSVYINGSFKKPISYSYKNSYIPLYMIFYGIDIAEYYINTHQLYIPDCGYKDIENLKDALYYTIRCYEIGSY